MLKEKTMELMDQAEELMKKAIGDTLDIEDIGDLDDTQVTYMRSMCKLYSTAKELSIYQAELIDEQNKKLDKLLEHNAELVRLLQQKD